MNKSASKQRMILLSVVALLLSFLIIIFFTVARISDLKTLSTEAKAKEAELEAGIAQVQSVRNATQLIKVAKGDMQTLGIAIPDQEKGEEALAQLGANAASSGLEIKSIAIGGGDASNLGISVATTGSFDQTMTFLANLEKNLRPVKVKNYTFAAVEDSSSVDASFALLFPNLPSEASTGSGGEATAEPTATSVESEVVSNSGVAP